MIKKRMAGPICDQGARTGDGDEGGLRGGWVGERGGVTEGKRKRGASQTDALE